MLLENFYLERLRQKPEQIYLHLEQVGELPFPHVAMNRSDIRTFDGRFCMDSIVNIFCNDYTPEVEKLVVKCQHYCVKITVIVWNDVKQSFVWTYENGYENGKL